MNILCFGDLHFSSKRKWFDIKIYDKLFNTLTEIIELYNIDIVDIGGDTIDEPSKYSKLDELYLEYYMNKLLPKKIVRTGNHDIITYNDKEFVKKIFNKDITPYATSAMSFLKSKIQGNNVFVDYNNYTIISSDKTAILFLSYFTDLSDMFKAIDVFISKVRSNPIIKSVVILFHNSFTDLTIMKKEDASISTTDVLSYIHSAYTEFNGKIYLLFNHIHSYKEATFQEPEFINDKIIVIGSPIPITAGESNDNRVIVINTLEDNPIQHVLLNVFNINQIDINEENVDSFVQEEIFSDYCSFSINYNLKTDILNKLNVIKKTLYEKYMDKIIDIETSPYSKEILNIDSEELLTREQNEDIIDVKQELYSKIDTVLKDFYKFSESDIKKALQSLKDYIEESEK
jgi:hypothetical protein